MDYQREFLLAVKNGQLPKVSALCANKTVNINKTDQVYSMFLYDIRCTCTHFKYVIGLAIKNLSLQL